MPQTQTVSPTKSVFLVGILLTTIIGGLGITAYLYFKSSIGETYRNNQKKALWQHCRQIKNESDCTSERKCFWDVDYLHIDCGFNPDDYCGPVCIPKACEDGNIGRLCL